VNRHYITVTIIQDLSRQHHEAIKQNTCYICCMASAGLQRLLLCLSVFLLCDHCMCQSVEQSKHFMVIQVM